MTSQRHIRRLWPEFILRRTDPETGRPLRELIEEWETALKEHDKQPVGCTVLYPEGTHWPDGSPARECSWLPGEYRESRDGRSKDNRSEWKDRSLSLAPTDDALRSIPGEEPGDPWHADAVIRQERGEVHISALERAPRSDEADPRPDEAGDGGLDPGGGPKDRSVPEHAPGDVHYLGMSWNGSPERIRADVLRHSRWFQMDVLKYVPDELGQSIYEGVLVGAQDQKTLAGMFRLAPSTISRRARKAGRLQLAERERIIEGFIYDRRLFRAPRHREHDWDREPRIEPQRFSLDAIELERKRTASPMWKVSPEGPSHGLMSPKAAGVWDRMLQAVPAAARELREAQSIIEGTARWVKASGVPIRKDRPRVDPDFVHRIQGRVLRGTGEASRGLQRPVEPKQTAWWRTYAPGAGTGSGAGGDPFGYQIRSVMFYPTESPSETMPPPAQLVVDNPGPSAELRKTVSETRNSLGELLGISRKEKSDEKHDIAVQGSGETVRAVCRSPRPPGASPRLAVRSDDEPRGEVCGRVARSRGDDWPRTAPGRSG